MMNKFEKYADIKKYPTLTTVSKERQSYVDEPVWQTIAEVKGIVKALGRCFKGFFVPEDIVVVVEYRRHILKWVKP
jgi:hypothetical protein